ncbi:hypothetical protein ACFVAJ_20670 [Agromyces sp. NPDC057679]|uniref:hypothetical protein n=1 Tax=Agromyces sp. NPDC057679 TaxID=3346207 RepID=UPI003670401F
MTPEEAEAELAALFDETETLIGGSWENHDSPVPRACEPVSGGTGVQFRLQRFGEGETDSAAIAEVAERVAALWKEHGYESTISDEGELGIEVAAQNDRRSHLLFGMNTNATTLDGGSSCEPGDPDDEKYYDYLEDPTLLE